MTAYAARLEIEEVPINPGKPSGTWQRLRVRDAVRTLYDRGTIDRAAWLAVRQFRADRDLMLGVRDGEPGMRVSGGPKQPMTDAMLDASMRVSGAWRAIEPERLLCAYCVVAEGALALFEADQRIRNGSATPRLIAMLDRLAAYYSQFGGVTNGGN